MSECLTHHHACDCREAKFAKLETDFAQAQMELAAHTRAMHDALSNDGEAASKLTPLVYGKGWITCAQFINSRVAELLAQEGGK